MTQKSIWGNACWFLFHVSAIKLKVDSFEQVQKLLDKIMHICRNLPCPICSGHANEMFRTMRKESIKTKKDLIMWLFNFHNTVNKRIRLPQFSIEDHNKMYTDAPLNKIINNWIAVMSRNSPGQRSMLYTMTRNNMVKQTATYFVNNRDSFD